ncbi:hypothetical protein HDU79_002348, partial [Rhizoclosmatium sp. JEL0117]
TSLSDRWDCLARELGFSESFRSRGLKGDSSVPYGPGTSLRYFVIRSQDNSSVDATASISFFENGAYIHLVAGQDVKSFALVWHALTLAKELNVGVLGVDTTDPVVKERYEELGFVTIPNLEGYVLKL